MDTSPVTYGDLSDYCEACGTTLSGMAIRLLTLSKDEYGFNYSVYEELFDQLMTDAGKWVNRNRDGKDRISE